MKTFLLMLAMAVGVVHAQDEVALSSAFGAGEGVNGEVLAVVIQADGKIVIGGRFSAVNGIVRNSAGSLVCRAEWSKRTGERAGHPAQR